MEKQIAPKETRRHSRSFAGLLIPLLIGLEVVASGVIAVLLLLTAMTWGTDIIDRAIVQEEPELRMMLEGLGRFGLGGVFALLAVNVALGLLLLDTLRRLCRDVRDRTPFSVRNVASVQRVAILLAGCELLSLALELAVGKLIANRAIVPEFFNPMPWIGVLAAFVLAEVFREGARLRDEADKTI